LPQVRSRDLAGSRIVAGSLHSGAVRTGIKPVGTSLMIVLSVPKVGIAAVFVACGSRLTRFARTSGGD
jgi:hypothetical protein